jgi:putative transposase
MWRCLRVAAPRFGVDVNAYVFMTNHIHLMLTPNEENSIQRMMQWAEHRYSAYFNKRYRRIGALFEGRYKASVIEDDNYFLTCHRYMDLNPVRAGMVEHPADYGWSSFRHYALGEANPLVVPHEALLQLGYNDESRRQAYAAMTARPMDAESLYAIRASMHSCSPMGVVVRRGRRTRRNGV